MVAPRFKEASLNFLGTAIKLTKDVLIIVGKIIINKTKITLSKQSPAIFSFANFLTKGTTTVMPKKPYITEGIAAKTSTIGFKIKTSFLFAISLKNVAVKTPKGAAKKTAPAVAKMEAKIKFLIPKTFNSGTHCEPKINLKKPILKIAGEPETTK